MRYECILRVMCMLSTLTQSMAFFSDCLVQAGDGRHGVRSRNVKCM